MTVREELIQVAAIAVAIIEYLDYGIADARRDVWPPYHSDQSTISQSERVVFDVVQERLKQDDKWGPQAHDTSVELPGPGGSRAEEGVASPLLPSDDRFEEESEGRFHELRVRSHRRIDIEKELAPNGDEPGLGSELREAFE